MRGTGRRGPVSLQCPTTRCTSRVRDGRGPRSTDVSVGASTRGPVAAGVPLSRCPERRGRSGREWWVGQGSERARRLPPTVENGRSESKETTCRNRPVPTRDDYSCLPVPRKSHRSNRSPVPVPPTTPHSPCPSRSTEYLSDVAPDPGDPEVRTRVTPRWSRLRSGRVLPPTSPPGVDGVLSPSLTTTASVV